MLVWFSSRIVLDFHPNNYKGFWRIWGADRARLCFLQSYMCYSFYLLFALAVCSIVFLLLRNTANFLIKENHSAAIVAVHLSSLSIPKFPAPQKIWSHCLLQLEEDRRFGSGQARLLTLLRTRHQAPLWAAHSRHKSFKSTSGYDKYCWSYFSIGFVYKKNSCEK